MLEQFEGQRVVVLAGRYIWRGVLTRYDDPFVHLAEARQVVDHGEDEERGGHDVGEAILTVMAIESVYPESGARWCQTT